MSNFIAFVGWGGSGKSKAAEYLSFKYDYEIVSFATPVKYIDKYLFGNGKKDRKRLQKIAEFFRDEFDPDIWVKKAMEYIDCEQKVVVDDLRRMNEYEALIKKGFKIYRIVADEKLRIKRLIERDGQCDTSILYNKSENGCSNLDLPEIENNGTLEELYEKLDKLMLDLSKS